MLYIGIDAGVNTGVAVWDDKQRKLLSVESMQLHQALEKVLNLHLTGKICVIIEDARFARGTVMIGSRANRSCKAWAL